MKIDKILYLLRRFAYYFYGEKFYKRLNFAWQIKPTRLDIIEHFIKRNNYKSYLEIGCCKNEVFSKINIKKVGVDPNSGGTVRLTSDDFFKTNKEKFDLVFIDGLHVYDQVKQDIINSLEVLNNNGVILIHDCLPEKIWEQNVPRMNGAWSGDVWKVIPFFRSKSNIDVYTCVADRGIGIIFKRYNKNILKLDQDTKKLKFKDYYYNYKSYMNLVSSEELENII
jgi:hypothetical protein